MKKLIFLFLAVLFVAGCEPKPTPTYFTFEDLRRGMRDESFYFANYSRPIQAGVDLGCIPLCAANANRRYTMARTFRANPSKYRVKITNIGSNKWNDSYSIDFDWDKFFRWGGERGDLIFLRCNGQVPDFVKIFSGWTHVAIVDNVLGNNVFETMHPHGVDVNFAPESWGKVCYYTCKKIDGLSYVKKDAAIKQAEHLYGGLPYFPKVDNVLGLVNFIFQWADKNDLNSFYCSKLVYNTFKDYVNLDTNNTSVYNSLLWDRAWGAPMFSWTGVSPDDIYYSDALGYDFCYSTNLVYDGLWRAGAR